MKKLFTLLCLYHSTSFAQFPETLELGELNGQDGFVFNGADAHDWTGFAAKSAGDINGDGLTDFIIGSDGAGLSGKVYLIFGQDTKFEPSYQVSDLVGDFGLIIDTSVSGGFLGWSVDGLGDVNGDGIDDIVIGNLGYDQDNLNIGQAYVIFGNASGFPDSIDVTNLNGSNGFSLTGDEAFSFGQLGESVSAAGDINNDGFMDIAVAAPRTNQDFESAGSVYVIYGTDSGFAADIDLSVITSSTGFVLTGELPGIKLGWNVRLLGDVNGDGIDDLGLSTEYNNNSDASKFAYVLYGDDNGFPVDFSMSNIDGSNGFRIHGSDIQRTQIIIASAGDLNGDGRPDISIGSRLRNHLPGRAKPYVLFGRSDDFPENVYVNDLDGITGFSILNPDSDDIDFSQSAGVAGDINSDGIDDLFIGTFSGTSFILGYMIFGSENLIQPVFDLTSLNGQNGFKVRGQYNTPLNTLVPIAALEDMNGDGLNDFAIGNQWAKNNGVTTGAAYVVFGKQKQDLIFKSGFE